MSDNDITHGPAKISRRTLAVGAAWSVPVIAVASAAPAMAASECLKVTFGEGSCKDPGNPFGYRMKFCFVNSCTTGIATIQVTKVQAQTSSNPALTRQAGGAGGALDSTDFLPVNVGPGSTPTCSTQIVTGFSSNSASSLIVSFTINGGPTQTVTVSAPPSTAHCTV